MAGPVFISHSSRDVKVARDICDAIERRGMRCWISGRDVGPGDNFGDAIVDAIERAKVMVLVFSANANNSEEIKKEIALASQHRVAVIPVRVEDITPSNAFRYELATRQWIDMFVSWDEGLKRLTDKIAAIQAIAEPVGATPSPAPRPTPAPSSPPVPAPRRANWLFPVAGAAALIAVAMVAGFIWLRPSAPGSAAEEGKPAAQAALAPVATPMQATAPANSVAPPSSSPASTTKVAAAQSSATPSAPAPKAAEAAPEAPSHPAPLVTIAPSPAAPPPRADPDEANRQPLPAPKPAPTPGVAEAPPAPVSAPATSAAAEPSPSPTAPQRASPDEARQQPPPAPKPAPAPAPVVAAPAPAVADASPTSAPTPVATAAPSPAAPVPAPGSAAADVAPKAPVLLAPAVAPAPSATPASTLAAANPAPVVSPPRPVVVAALSATTPASDAHAPVAGAKGFKDCETCPEMVVAPRGAALIGSPPQETARLPQEPAPSEAVISAPFAVGRFDVTFDEWDACVAEGGCNAWRPGDFNWGRGRQPVIFVSWKDAKAYVYWLAKKTGKPYRLLSETEWEYAARGCTTTACPNQPFWFGTIKPELANYDARYAYEGSPKGLARRRATPVDEGAPNPFGLYNMLGNVRQWVEDCWTANPGPPPPNGAARLDGDCADRVTRGGSYDDKPQELRAAARSWETADTRSQKIGFRVARALDP